MKYTVEVAGRGIEVELDSDRVAVDGRVVDARLSGDRGSGIRRLVRGRAAVGVQATPGEGRGAWLLAMGGCRLLAQVLDPRERAVRAAGSRAGAAPGGGTLKAPMPGLVVRVLVEEGERVLAGQGLVVVEAMKMENVLKAEGPGVVQKVHVVPGARVEKGAPLLELA
jgi:biotin carboxyl carrier protein